MNRRWMKPLGLGLLGTALLFFTIIGVERLSGQVIVYNVECITDSDAPPC